MVRPLAVEGREAMGFPMSFRWLIHDFMQLGCVLASRMRQNAWWHQTYACRKWAGDTIKAFLLLHAWGLWRMIWASWTPSCKRNVKVNSVDAWAEGHDSWLSTLVGLWFSHKEWGGAPKPANSKVSYEYPNGCAMLKEVGLKGSILSRVDSMFGGRQRWLENSLNFPMQWLRKWANDQKWVLQAGGKHGSIIRFFSRVHRGIGC